MRHLAIYARISKDRAGRAEGVALQEKRGRAYAAERWPDLPVAVYCDNDLSAARDDIVRPQFQAMLAAVRRGEVAHVVCAEQSRLTRQPAEWESLSLALAKAGIEAVHCYRTGPVDVANSRLIGRILAAVDAEEVERTRARTIAKHAELAAQGRPSGTKPFGYVNGRNSDGQATFEIDPEQAAAARWAAAAVLQGRSITGIAHELQERGVPTARGGRWASTSVRSMLTAPTIVGLRTHHGELRPGTWEPILDRQTWDAVREALTGPTTVISRDGKSRPVSRRRSPERRYLLTGGIALCGKCGQPLMAFVRRERRSVRRPTYVCKPRVRGGCAGVGISADPLEAMVADELLKRLDSPQFRAALAEGDPHEEQRASILRQLEALEGRRSELAARWAAGEITSTDWDTARAVLDAHGRAAETELGSLPPPVFDLEPDAIRDGWEWATMNERRDVVALFVESVTVAPAKPGTRKWDPGRVDIDWA